MRNWKTKFWHDPLARIGAGGIAVLLFLALAAPLLANGKPFLLWNEGEFSFPFLRSFFAPDSTEFLMEQILNYLFLALIAAGIFALSARRLPRRTKIAGEILIALVLLIPFALTTPKMDRTDYRARAKQAGNYALFAPIPYGPNEIIGSGYVPPCREHFLGLDEAGRSVASRMIYGARASLSCGIFAAAAALGIGTVFGLLAGFFRGWFDLIFMRGVEILLCFPTFLLLLILMSILKDYKFEQSIIVVIAILALTGWIGLAYLVRGEVLRQMGQSYVQSCIVAGIPVLRTLFVHILPNITAPILISFTFSSAGAILAESSLSFLGFGVQPPTASWGGLLRQAFDNPFSYWHLMLFPGLALFIAVMSFHFTGEGLRKAFSAHEEERA